MFWTLDMLPIITKLFHTNCTSCMFWYWCLDLTVFFCTFQVLNLLLIPFISLCEFFCQSEVIFGSLKYCLWIRYTKHTSKLRYLYNFCHLRFILLRFLNFKFNIKYKIFKSFPVCVIFAFNTENSIKWNSFNMIFIFITELILSLFTEKLLWKHNNFSKKSCDLSLIDNYTIFIE